MSKVSLVWVTPDAEHLIAYMARVSNPANQGNTEYAKLIGYLKKHQHWSPFEMVNVCIEIETTRDIARQILRHRSFSFQEFSQRYAEVQGFEYGEARLQHPKDRQASVEALDKELHRVWHDHQGEVLASAQKAYRWALSNGIAKEVARKVLPEGLTMSRMYMSGTLRSWIHYTDIRCEQGTQKEHREVAQKCRDILADLFPNVFTEEQV